jgi:hypothetical protein
MEDGFNVQPNADAIANIEAPASFADRLPSHFVTKLHHAALVGFDLRQMEGDVLVELLEKWNPITNQDRQDRIPNFVGQSETKAFGGDGTASNKPDGTERGPQPPIHELREIA